MYMVMNKALFMMSELVKILFGNYCQVQSFLPKNIICDPKTGHFGLDSFLK